MKKYIERGGEGGEGGILLLYVCIYSCILVYIVNNSMKARGWSILSIQEYMYTLCMFVWIAGDHALRKLRKILQDCPLLALTPRSILRSGT